MPSPDFSFSHTPPVALGTGGYGVSTALPAAKTPVVAAAPSAAAPASIAAPFTRTSVAAAEKAPVFGHVTDAPVAKSGDYARSAVAPAAIATAFSRSGVAPQPIAAGFDATNEAAVQKTSDYAPSEDAAQPLEVDMSPDTTPAKPYPRDAVPAQSLPTMPSNFIPAFVELTGGGTSLEMLPASAADAAAGRILQGTVAGQLKSYQVRTGTDATQVPGIVRAFNFDADTNPVVFVQL